MDDPLSNPAPVVAARVSRTASAAAPRRSASSVSSLPEVPDVFNALTGSAWADRKERILEQYSVKGTFKVTASFMGSSGENVSVDNQTKSVSLKTPTSASQSSRRLRACRAP